MDHFIGLTDNILICWDILDVLDSINIFFLKHVAGEQNEFGSLWKLGGDLNLSNDVAYEWDNFVGKLY